MFVSALSDSGEVVKFKAFSRVVSVLSFGAEFRNMVRDSFRSGHGRQFQAQVCKNRTETARLVP